MSSTTPKKTVHYSPVNAYIVVGERASVFAYDHYSARTLRNSVTNTSTVLKYDMATGIFETVYSIYVPLETY